MAVNGFVLEPRKVKKCAEGLETIGPNFFNNI